MKITTRKLRQIIREELVRTNEAWRGHGPALEWFGDIVELQGQTLINIEGCEPGSHEILFNTSDGRTYRMFHEQDYEEFVSVEDVVGDPADLLDVPILRAEVRTNEDTVQTDVAQRRTFYELATVNGTVTIRWFGESDNYSTAVTFEEI